MIKLDAHKAVHFCDGMTRRDFLHAGSLARCLGLTLAGPPRAEGRRRGPHGQGRQLHHALPGRRAVSQLDTWDMKPDAPAEIRGPFRPIKTNVPGHPDHARSSRAWRSTRTSSRWSASVYHTGAGGPRHRPPDDADGPAVPGGHRAPARRLRAGQAEGAEGRHPAARAAAPADRATPAATCRTARSAGFLGKTFDPFVLNADPVGPRTSRSPTCCRRTTSPPSARSAAASCAPRSTAR